MDAMEKLLPHAGTIAEGKRWGYLAIIFVTVFQVAPSTN